ncbi:alpha/beta hydrolase [Mucilaginibacter agri]|uniref:Phospholipase n=1 Tax=Mucilaginibacter agri TaxID=2695265 RepID=A0A966DU31_9SPHI|nr:dienelactone hydrolase family protein [Mucilaginibacter agri]NCD69967.1 phospholipase [Mucilaginibacter agri]
MYTHEYKIITAGVKPQEAKGALILLHGRGSTAHNMVGLANELDVADFAIYAPQATNHSWYPYSFLAPVQDNEPALSSALGVITQLVKQIEADGIPTDRIYFMGFSQGACLTLEYITRNAQQYGGAVAFTGGLIGEELNLANYTGSFKATPVLITTGDPDPHVPVSRVQQSVKQLTAMDANVILKIYKGRPHTITQEEIDLANQLVFDK